MQPQALPYISPVDKPLGGHSAPLHVGYSTEEDLVTGGTIEGEGIASPVSQEPVQVCPPAWQPLLDNNACLL